MVKEADRLCTPTESKDRRTLGLTTAARAFDDVFGAASSSFKAPPLDSAAELKKAVALTLSRCAVLNADFESEKEKILQLTDRGADAAVAAGGQDGDPVAAYYLALNLGLHIKTQGMGAAGRVKDVVAALKTAGKRPKTDMGGPLRVLGYLYLKAPAWPLGPGDLDESLALLKDACLGFPSHPLNHIFFAEALIEDDNTEEASTHLNIAKELTRSTDWGDYAALWLAQIQALSARLEP
jgi:hypothetical protein